METDKTQSAVSGMRVLIVDDDESVRLVLQSLLISDGCEAEVAENGRTALQILLRHDFDIVLVDLRMQGMDGIAFVEEARNIWPWLGFIIMTGFSDDLSQDQANALGIKHVLQKPVLPDVLAKTLADEFSTRRLRMGMSSTGMEQHQRQLRILGHLSEAALASNSFIEALNELSEGLGELMACDLAGLLGFSDDQKFIVLNAQRPVSETLMRQAEEEIIHRYQALSGKSLVRSELRIQWEGEKPLAPESMAAHQRVLTIPIIVANEVQGLFLLASASPDGFVSTDISFLYHVANLLSAVLVAVTRMRQLAVHDSLTGLYNRAHLDEQMERAWHLARRHGHSMAVAIMDLDHFKVVNDTHGHHIGDQVLHEFAAIIRSVARSSDIVARYGGDEFVVVLPQTELPAGLIFGDRLRVAVMDHSFCADTIGLKMTVSIGVATTLDIDPSMKSLELLRLADLALYAAKRDGRNLVRLWSKGPRDALGEKPGVDNQPVKRHRGHLFLVDDEPSITKVVGRILEEEGYQVDTEQAPLVAMERLRKSPGLYDVVITDLHMPDANGLELIDVLQETDRMSVSIVLTGYATKDSAVSSLRRGVFEFIEKPIRTDELLAVVERAIDYRRLRVENERYRMRLEDMVQQKSAALQEALDRLKHSHDFTLQALASMLDAREHATGKHCVRVRDMAVFLGKAMDLAGEELNTLAQGALLHDIGKISVPDAILLKQDKLTDAEWKVMKTHAEVGYNIIKISPYLDDVAELIYTHHERYDGTGYPRGLREAQIPLGARIFSVVDAYDAMRSHRPYRLSLGTDGAMAEIRRCAGSQFDPAIVPVFLRCIHDIEKIGSWPSV